MVTYSNIYNFTGVLYVIYYDYSNIFCNRRDDIQLDPVVKEQTKWLRFDNDVNLRIIINKFDPSPELESIIIVYITP